MIVKNNVLPVSMVMGLVLIVALGVAPVSASGNDDCSIPVNPNLSFTIPAAAYDTGSPIGSIDLSATFAYFDTQSGMFRWKLENVSSPVSTTCVITVSSDQSFTLGSVTIDGQEWNNAVFAYFGHTQAGDLWYLDHIDPPAPSTDTSVPPGSSTPTDCGAYVAPEVWKVFDCYNLAAIGKITGDDPLTPSWRLIGGYWQWGRKGPDSSQWYDTNTEHFAHGPTGPGDSEANAGPISDWDYNYADSGAWSDSVKTKTDNDPCPDGFRVPTTAQWQGVIENNTQSTVGTWEDDDTNYDSARFFGNTLMLPAAGRRYGLTSWFTSNPDAFGKVLHRGNSGYYWSSSAYGGHDSLGLSLSNDRASTDANTSRQDGSSIRCIAE